MKKILLSILALMLSAGLWAQEKITLTAADFTVTKDGDWTYDQTEKRVNVEFISVENPGPPADKVEIYYNNDKMVRPIEPGTYQVYIDIEETDIYAAVTGITSDAWKFDIIDREGAYSAINEAIAAAQNAINTVANDYENVQEVKALIDATDAQFEEIKNEAADAIESATDQNTIAAETESAINSIADIEASTKEGIGNAIANFKESVKNEIDNAATDAKYTINNTYHDVYQKYRTDAIADIDDAVTRAKTAIDNADSEEKVNNAKATAINIIDTRVSIVEDYNNKLQAAKKSAFNDIVQAAVDAEIAIEEAAGEGYETEPTIYSIVHKAILDIDNFEEVALSHIEELHEVIPVEEHKESSINQINNIPNSMFSHSVLTN